MNRKSVEILRKMLIRKLQSAEVAQILVAQAQRRIESKGQDVGGYAPLWADKAKLLIRTKKGGKRNKRGVRKGETYEMIRHYRAGGTPLYDTGKLFISMRAKTQSIANGIRMILQVPLYGIFQHHGFETSGPNFIPFTKGARRGQKAALKRREFVIAKEGVTVPARPIFAMPTTARTEVARAIARAMGAR